MFQRFRRARSARRTQRRISIVFDNRVVQPPKASFLGLPSELRNAVYEQLAADTVLTPVVPSRRRKRSLPPTILLVCKQIHFEVKNVLLANATIHFQVPNYDFTGLISLLATMPSNTLQALISNPHLYVRLVVDNAPNKAQLDHINAWLMHRSEGFTHSESQDEDDCDPELHQLVFRYDAIVKASSMTTGLVNPLNMQVAILAAILRQLPRLGNEECFRENSCMYRGLAMHKNRLIGLRESTDIEMPAGIKSNLGRDLMPQIWVPQYR